MRTSKYFIFFTIILLLQNCSQTRKGSIGQTYQNFNSRYNTYFNSKEKFALSYHAVKQKHIDDYDLILPIYELDNSNEAFTGQADLNVIEEKVGKLVAKYPASRWSDNGLLLVGKARYYKGEYAKAIKCLEYITSEYKKGFKTEELKKPKGKPTKKEKAIKEAEKTQIPIEEGSFEHTPSRNDAMIFLAKSYTKLEKYAEAQSIISYAESDMTFPKEKRLELKKLQAFLYLEKKDYNGAEQSLKGLLKVKKQKKLKARASFILGQLFELNKKPDSAYKFFEFVLKNKPSDLMEFNAKLHMARMAGSSAGDAEKLLIKMSKEGKNEDYLDVIFFELGELKRKKGEEEEAVNYYLKSISKTKENKHQQALSFIRLGEMQYDKEQYSDAYPFYDSSISRYNTKLKTFDFIKRRTAVLKDINDNEKIISLEDSIQALAKLGKEEAKKAIKAQLKAQLKLSKKEEEEREFLASKPTSTATTSGSQDWYFGNAAMMQSGLAEFKKIWKDRKLEDDWRRSGKTNNQEKNEPEDPTIKNKYSGDVPSLTLDESADKNLALIPFEPSQINASNDKIIEALYILGNQFKDGVENYPKAIQTFEELNRRFPKTNTK
ncbi:MAG: tetratricopeptide repeat protein [Bacteroidetes bacterium]|nr:tetratricopeptide repeat protein [Bacteroidota bacterium]